MAREVERNPNRWPGKFKEYALFQRPASSHDPNAWKIVGKPTHKHEELRDIVMPEEMVQGKLFGVAWVDNFTGYEYKIMECTVERSQWRDEAKAK